MYDLYSMNIRRPSPGRDPLVTFRLEIPDEYRQRLEGDLKAAGITDYNGPFHGSFFDHIERAMYDYMEDKQREIITPAKIRITHKDALDAINEAHVKLDAMYEMRGASDLQALKREISHQKSLEDAREYLESLKESIDSLQQRLPNPSLSLHLKISI